MNNSENMKGAKNLVYSVVMPIRWGDMDAIGHVNNTIYFRYIEQARIEWLSKIGCLPDSNGFGPVIVNAHCTFLRPLKYPDQVEVNMFVGAIGRTSMETICELRSVSDAYALYAEGGAKIVWFDPASEKSVPLPEQLLKFKAKI